MLKKRYRGSKKLVNAIEDENSRRLGIIKNQLKKYNPSDPRIKEIRLYVFGYRMSKFLLIYLTVFLVISLYLLINR